MKKIVLASLVFSSISTFAACQVSLGYETFVENTCRDALRACNKYKMRTGASRHQSCEITNQNVYAPRVNDRRVEPRRSTRGQIITASGNLIEDTLNFRINGCQIERNSWGDLELIVGQSRLAKFSSYEKSALSREIQTQLSYGYCHYKSAQEINLMLSPQLIDDMVYGGYQNCHVKLRVSGWANQIYINGQFKGNYDTNKVQDQKKLKAVLASYVTRGICAKAYRTHQTYNSAW